MRTHALIEDGKVSEIIPPYVNPDGVDVPIEERYTPNMVAQMVDITDMDPQPQQQWTYDGVTFAAPAPYQPTPADILRENQNTQYYLLGQASQAMTPLLLALQLDGADEVTTKAKAWQAYYKQLEAVDVTVPVPDWPTAPA
jgi:hypothetical protein